MKKVQGFCSVPHPEDHLRGSVLFSCSVSAVELSKAPRKLHLRILGKLQQRNGWLTHGVKEGHTRKIGFGSSSTTLSLGMKSM